MENVGHAALQIIPSFKGFEGKLSSGSSSAMIAAGRKGGASFGDEAGKSAGSRFRSAFATSAKLGAAGLVGLGFAAGKLFKDSVGLASNLKESLNAVNVSYGEQAKAVQYLGRQAATSLGLSNEEFNSLAVRFSAFSKTIAGGDGLKVVTTLDDLTHRASDFASVMNLEVNEAAELFQSGLAGETEPLRKFGIDLSAAKVEAFAYAEGIAKSGKELTEAQKVQARYGSLMEQTNKTQGDFLNTSDSLANRQRILNASWDDARAKLGKALLPLLEDLTGFVLKEGIPAFEKFTRWFSKDGMDGLEKFGGFLKDEVLPVLKDVGEFAKDAGEFVGDMLKKFNDLPDAGKLAALGTVLGGGAALKLRGGAGGALGTAGSVLGLAKPVPVFVTNPGFSAGGAGGGTAAGGITKGGAMRLAGATLLVGAGAEVLFGDSFGLRDQSQYEQQLNEGNGFGRMGAPQVLKGPDFSSNLGAEFKEAIEGTAQFQAAVAKLPKTIQTRFDLLGVPESKAEAKNLVDTYNLTPKEKRTLFQMLGYEKSKAEVRSLITAYDATPKEKRTLFELTGYSTLVDQIRNINTSLDYASRDRRTQITIAYSRAGHNTVGGLQEANGGILQAFADGGFSASGKYVSRVPQIRAGGDTVQWGEPETGWEAYISGKPSMRARNIAILAEVSRRLGVQRYADGGLSGRAPSVSVAPGITNVTVLLDGRQIDARVDTRVARHARHVERQNDRD